jgi:hypothetical protein
MAAHDTGRGLVRQTAALRFAYPWVGAAVAALPLRKKYTMFKLIITAGLVGLLAACSSMSGSSTTSAGSMSTATMGAPGTVQHGSGPRGSSGGGPN